MTQQGLFEPRTKLPSRDTQAAKILEYLNESYAIMGEATGLRFFVLGQRAQHYNRRCAGRNSGGLNARILWARNYADLLLGCSGERAPECGLFCG